MQILEYVGKLLIKKNLTEIFMPIIVNQWANLGVLPTR